ncbi:hypothetical protein NM65012_2160 [Neisseria meningitidis 65012]|nr:hypothetical protein NM65012_2160 [Neisseria meningitidis 65012]
MDIYSGLVRRCLALPYYLYCLRLRRLVLIFVNPLYECIGVKTSDYFLEALGFGFQVQH